MYTHFFSFHFISFHFIFNFFFTLLRPHTAVEDENDFDDFDFDDFDFDY
jgi:hypothetical protein